MHVKAARTTNQCKLQIAKCRLTRRVQVRQFAICNVRFAICNNMGTWPVTRWLPKKHSLRRLRQQPLFIARRQSADPIANQRDRRGIRVRRLHLIRRVAGPHAPLDAKRIEHAANQRDEIVIRRLLLAQRVVSR